MMSTSTRFISFSHSTTGRLCPCILTFCVSGWLAGWLADWLAVCMSVLLAVLDVYDQFLCSPVLKCVCISLVWACVYMYS